MLSAFQILDKQNSLIFDKIIRQEGIISFWGIKQNVETVHGQLFFRFNFDNLVTVDMREVQILHELVLEKRPFPK